MHLNQTNKMKSSCLLILLVSLLAVSCLPQIPSQPSAQHMPLEVTPFNTAVVNQEASFVVISPDDEAAIYAAVIRQIYTVDDTFGDKLQPLYIKDYTNDQAGDLNSQPNSVLIPEGVRSSVLAALHDLPVKLIWEVKSDLSRPYITLCNIYPQADGSVQVGGSIFFAPLAAFGQTYILQRSGAVWIVTGSTGFGWIS